MIDSYIHSYLLISNFYPCKYVWFCGYIFNAFSFEKIKIKIQWKSVDEKCWLVRKPLAVSDVLCTVPHMPRNTCALVKASPPEEEVSVSLAYHKVFLWWIQLTFFMHILNAYDKDKFAESRISLIEVSRPKYDVTATPFRPKCNFTLWRNLAVILPIFNVAIEILVP